MDELWTRLDNNKRYLVSSRSAVRYAWALMWFVLRICRISAKISASSIVW